MKRWTGSRLLAGLCRLDNRQKLLQLRLIASRSNHRANLIAKCCQPNGILLPEDEPGQCCCNALGVLELRKHRRRARISHALADIENQIANEVRLIFILLEIDLVAAAKHLP